MIRIILGGPSVRKGGWSIGASSEPESESEQATENVQVAAIIAHFNDCQIPGSRLFHNESFNAYSLFHGARVIVLKIMPLPGG